MDCTVNAVNKIPALYVNTPIGNLLKIYNSKITEMFIEKVLNNISHDEFEKVSKWADFLEKDIVSFIEYLSLNVANIEIALASIIQAVLLKKEFETRYPEHKVEYNEGCTPNDSMIATRRWLKVDGQDGKEFDEARNGAPITLIGV